MTFQILESLSGPITEPKLSLVNKTTHNNDDVKTHSFAHVHRRVVFPCGMIAYQRKRSAASSTSAALGGHEQKDK